MKRLLFSFVSIVILLGSIMMLSQKLAKAEDQLNLPDQSVDEASKLFASERIKLAQALIEQRIDLMHQSFTNKDKQPEKKIMQSETIKEVNKNSDEKQDTFVMMETEKGSFKIKLYMKDAPITAGNFLDLVKRKFYNGLTFHRIISGFVVQGGCPKGNGTGGFIDPDTGKERRIQHENNPKLKHNKAGILAMARTSDPNSASSQFFIDLAALPSLDAGGVDPYGYAVFGEIVEGMDVVEKIVKENVPPYPGSDGTANPVKIVSARVID
ncbi:MAG: peptidylprolyl isomerase [Candidatus Caenarcaniphilales bacterium]|jgi:cyclophilin family peptidyl-prolyl cis-trans isomerase|nr:peptidylprolyl isomerase [Candidatus Caenarcaniphilales bacterium]